MPRRSRRADVATSAAVAFALEGGVPDPLLLGPVVCCVLALNAQAGLYRPGLQTYALDELPALAARGAVAWCVAAAVLAAFDRPAALHWLALLAAVAANAALALRGAGDRARSAALQGVAPSPSGARRGQRTAGADDRRRSSPPTPGTGCGRSGFVELGESDRTATGESGGKTHLALADDRTEIDEAPLPVVVALEDVTRAIIQNTVRDVVFLHSPWEQPHNALLAGLLSERGWPAGWCGRDARWVCTGRTTSGPAHVWGFSCRRLSLECPRPGWSWRKRLLDLALVDAGAARRRTGAGVLRPCRPALGRTGSDLPAGAGRPGRRPFTLLKFRTLRPANEREAATLWSVAGDERMSPVGRLLRRTSLDELPQLWNVMRGDMSLVGPRPERPYFVPAVQPGVPRLCGSGTGSPVGITGLAQVHGLRGNTSIEDRARFDNHYIETWSLWQDVRIMMRTR